MGRLFRVHDGDSFRALIEHQGEIRLMGIDCPEISAKPGTLVSLFTLCNYFLFGRISDGEKVPGV